MRTSHLIPAALAAFTTPAMAQCFESSYGAPAAPATSSRVTWAAFFWLVSSP